MDYVWDEHGVMSYGPVPCPTPSYMSTPVGTQTYMALGRGVAARRRGGHRRPRRLLPPFTPRASPRRWSTRPGCSFMPSRLVSPSPMWRPPSRLRMEHDACDKVFEEDAREPRRRHFRSAPTRRRTPPRAQVRLLQHGYRLDPSQVDPAAASSAMEAIKSDPDVVVEEAETVPPRKFSSTFPTWTSAPSTPSSRRRTRLRVVQKNTVAPMPVTTPNVVGAPLTGCYELDSFPPRGTCTPSPTSSSTSTAPVRLPSCSRSTPRSSPPSPAPRRPPTISRAPTTARVPTSATRCATPTCPQVQRHRRLLRRVRAHRRQGVRGDGELQDSACSPPRR